MSVNFHKTFVPMDADAVALDIEEGKTAYVDGVKITGTKGANNDIVVQVVNPTGVSDAAYQALQQHEALLIHNVSLATKLSSAFNLQTSGYSYTTTSGGTYAGYTTVPAYTTAVRKYEVWGKTKDAALTDAMGARIQFNVADDSTDFWQAYVQWDSGSGFFEILLVETTASVTTTRASANFTTGLDVPSKFHLTVYEQDDSVIVQCTMYETDAITDDEAISCSYTVGSRPNKSSTKFRIGGRGAANDEWLFRGCMVSDID